MTAVLIHFDGLCEPRNPGGYGCYGFTIHVDGEFAAQGCNCIGSGPGTTNNAAEYAALNHALAKARDMGLLADDCDVECRGDSKLVVEQVNGNWRINKPHLRAAVDEALALLRQPRSWRMTWIPRDENERADELSRNAYRHATGKEPPRR